MNKSVRVFIFVFKKESYFSPRYIIFLTRPGNTHTKLTLANLITDLNTFDVAIFGTNNIAQLSNRSGATLLSDCSFQQHIFCSCLAGVALVRSNTPHNYLTFTVDRGS